MMNRTLYSILLYLAVPFIWLRLQFRARQAPAYRQRIAERFALKKLAFKPGGIWLHAVSVGESIAAAPVIKQLQQLYPQLPITLTCMTPTGSERIQALFGDSVQHCYLPYDLPCAAKRFLNQVQPKLAIVMETELWPNHIHQCYLRSIPVVLANARLSARSAKGYAKFQRLTAPMLAELSGIAVQSQAEAERFLQLGAQSTAVQVTGSIKFDLSVAPELLQSAAQLADIWHLASRFVWVAGSTHAGEDELILQAHQQLLQQVPEALLILVPRHPERFNQVAQLIEQQGLRSMRRSQQRPLQAADQVLLGDSMGELMLWYAVADAAFVGGTWVDNGGHNFLEPAALAKPIAAGPSRFNFLEIAEQLQQAGALTLVSTPSALAEQLLDWQQSEALCQQQGQAGIKVLQQNQGALAQLIGLLKQQLEKPSSSS